MYKRTKESSTIPLTAQDFVSKWKRAEARQCQSVQECFIDLDVLVGHEMPRQADPTGKRYVIERGSVKTGAAIAK